MANFRAHLNTFSCRRFAVCFEMQLQARESERPPVQRQRHVLRWKRFRQHFCSCSNCCSAPSKTSKNSPSSALSPASSSYPKTLLLTSSYHPQSELVTGLAMASLSSRKRPPTSSTSRRGTPLASFKRPAKPQEGQRKKPRPEQPPSRLRNRSEPAQSVLSGGRLDAEIKADEVDDETLDHVIMAVDIRDRDSVGCAYYIAREQSLRCMEDVAGGGKEVLDICQTYLLALFLC